MGFRCLGSKRERRFLEVIRTSPSRLLLVAGETLVLFSVRRGSFGRVSLPRVRNSVLFSVLVGRSKVVCINTQRNLFACSLARSGLDLVYNPFGGELIGAI